MVYCPFQPPSGFTVHRNGSPPLCVTRFHQHKGLVLARTTLPVSEAPQTLPFQGFCQLAIIIRGSLSLSPPRRPVLNLNAGEWFLIFDPECHYRSSTPSETAILCYECGQSFWKHLRQDGDKTCENCLNSSCPRSSGFDLYSGKVPPHDRIHFESLFALQGDSPLERLSVASRSLELFATLIRLASTRKAYPNSLCEHDRLAILEVARILENEPDADHSLRSISRRVHLNEFKLKAGFREVFNQTVFGFLREKRMQIARDMITRTNCSILEAANRVGYSNPSHFSRAYREFWGCNPRHTRNRNPSVAA